MNEKLSKCLNCEQSLPNLDNFCPNCGQKNHATKLKLHSFLNELMENIFNVDARIWLTLKMAVSNVGQLAKEFNQGKRKKYISPIQFYLFCSLFYFLILGMIAKADGDKTDVALKELIENRDSMTVGLMGQVFKIEMQEYLTIPTYSKQQMNNLLEKNGASPTFYNRFLLQRSVMAVTKGVGAMQQQLTSIASAGMFLLIPVLGWLFYLFFSKTYPFYVEHLVFVIYSQSIIFLVNAFKNTSRFFDIFGYFEIFNWVAALTYIGITIYSAVAIKQFYNKDWLKTIGYFVLLLLFYGIILITFLVSILIIGLMFS